MGTKTQKLSNVVDQIVEWQSVFTGDGSTGLTAVAGRGYFIDTTSGTVTVTLPASPKAGDIVQLKDYARTWGTNAVSIASALFDGVTKSNSFSTEGQTITLVYMDGTKGWSLINEDTTTGLNTAYITATGGTVTESGDFKIHTFTGDGCFVVSQLGAGIPCAQASTVDYLVVAGGGGGGAGHPNSGSAGSGAGAGGFRESKDSTLSSPHTASPLAATTGLTVTATTYPVIVGAGGSAATSAAPAPGPTKAGDGSSSSFSTITSAGGGYGGSRSWGNPGTGGSGTNTDCRSDGGPGGSGGGGNIFCAPVGATPGSAGTGNTPPVSPPQGQNGGVYTPGSNGAVSGGGATGAGATNNPGISSGVGGAGATSSINGTPTGRAGGGGGGQSCGGPGPGSASDGGGAGGPVSGPGVGLNGTTNTGGGAGGGGAPGGNGGAGGSGIVIIRYKFQ